MNIKKIIVPVLCFLATVAYAQKPMGEVIEKGTHSLLTRYDDKVVPLEYSKRAAETYGNATLKIIEKAGHGFTPNERLLSNQYVKAFLSR